MNSSNWVLDSPLEFNLNVSLCDAESPGFESRVTSSDMSLSQDTKNTEKQSGNLEEELNRMSKENKKLTQTLTTMCENYSVLQSHLINLLSQTTRSENSEENQKKRKACFEGIDQEEIKESSEQSYISYEDSYRQAWLLNCKPKVTRVLIRAEKSDAKLGVKDGYQWRKYGQKVTRDNPSPRAYFKCANAPLCPVKRKVQRSLEDPSILVATYEGEHNHAKPSSRDNLDQVVLGSIPEPNPNYKMVIRPDHNQLTMNPSLISSSNNHEDLQRLLVEKMSASLTKDPSFTSALAAAVSGNFSKGLPSHSQTWI